MNSDQGSFRLRRIDQDFRSIKTPPPLLACKRPRHAALGPSHSSPPPKCPQRIPLSEITNVDSSSYATPATARVKVPRFPLVSPTSSILDEDLDDEFLREVDALCEDRSAVKKESPGEEGINQSRKQNFFIDEDDDEPTIRKYHEYLNSLNDAQREAACSDISVPLMIVAGPGSGKTSTMVGRVLTLLKKGIGLSNILAMTFTTAAASEMRDRIGAVVGKSVAKELAVCTFHSFCLQLCRTHAEKLGRTTEFLIYGHGQQRRAVIEALRLVDSNKKNSTESMDHRHGEISVTSNANFFVEKSKKWQKFVTQAKASGRTPEDCELMGDEIGALILRSYNQILASCNALDYHDFISLSAKLLEEFPKVNTDCLEKWKAVLVDEFQDTSSMQYHLLRILASHKHVTIVGDEDQSIFSFNGANICGFDSFRRDFPMCKEIRLNRNYRSTRCIVDAASALICNNKRRCCFQQKAETENSTGPRITVKECLNEDAQCAFVTDKILEITSKGSDKNSSLGNVAILYRRQVSGKPFQVCMRDRSIPFNMHGVAFYRRKIIKAIMAMLKTTLDDCDDVPFRQAFKALFHGDKEEKKMVVEYIDRISAARKCSFLSAANDIFHAKISGTFKRAQLTQGRKVLSTLDMLSKLVRREHSISMVISHAGNMLPQKYLLEQRAVLDTEGGKLLNEDNDIRSVIQYLMDDVYDFLSSHFTNEEAEIINEDKGCATILKAFIDFISLREAENFRSRRKDNENSVTLTTIHQSKGLEWDTVFIVKANDSEIPLLHEFNGIVQEGGTTLEEERRLLYVAITRARKKLYIVYVTMDSSRQFLQPTRFLKEIPAHLFDIQGVTASNEVGTLPSKVVASNDSSFQQSPEKDDPDSTKYNDQLSFLPVNGNSNSTEDIDLSDDFGNPAYIYSGNTFLRRFNMEDRSMVSQLFHQWAKKQAFQHPNRLLDKINFVIDERLRSKTCKYKVVLRTLKSCLKDADAVNYAQYVINWLQIPSEQRAYLTREKQEHFLKQKVETSMGSAEATAKQIAYLQKLGCTTTPTSRLHASRLIEQYKSL